MDSKVEDKIVRQIEKNLSNNINENLFLTGRIFEKDTKANTSSSVMDNPDPMLHSTETSMDHSTSSYEFSNQPSTILSRAEYIRQARESCLRQLSAMSSGTATYNNIYPDVDLPNPEDLGHKKARAMKLFREDPMSDNEYKEENTPEEIASFRFLIIRTVCAIMLFLTIFIFDKFNFKIGGFTPEIVQEFVTGNDSLQELENILVTWLK